MLLKINQDIKIDVKGAGRVYADNAIYSVFENIISNAIKHGKTNKLDIDINCAEEFCRDQICRMRELVYRTK